MQFVIVDDDKILYHNPLSPETITAVQNLLRGAGCISPPFTELDPYLVATYITQFAMYGTEVTFLIDRNIYSQILAMAKGAVTSERTRVAAGLMAFASCANVHIEPSVAIYEGSASGAVGGWRNDLSLFRQVDKVHPGHWAALALGQIERFPPQIIGKRVRAQVSEHFDPKAKLKSHEFVYPHLLKLASLTRGPGNPDSKMCGFLDWMYASWQFSAPATLFACAILARDPPKNAFKNIGSANRNRALAGVKNAAWDLVYLTEWYKSIRVQEDNNRLTAVCSGDVLLLRVAELLREALFVGVGLPLLRKAGFGNLVLERYSALVSDLDNPKRALEPLPDDFTSYRKRLVLDLETDLLLFTSASR